MLFRNQLAHAQVARRKPGLDALARAFHFRHDFSGDLTLVDIQTLWAQFSPSDVHLFLEQVQPFVVRAFLAEVLKALLIRAGSLSVACLPLLVSWLECVFHRLVVCFGTTDTCTRTFSQVRTSGPNLSYEDREHT